MQLSERLAYHLKRLEEIDLKPDDAIKGSAASLGAGIGWVGGGAVANTLGKVFKDKALKHRPRYQELRNKADQETKAFKKAIDKAKSNPSKTNLKKAQQVAKDIKAAKNTTKVARLSQKFDKFTNKLTKKGRLLGRAGGAALGAVAGAKLVDRINKHLEKKQKNS